MCDILFPQQQQRDAFASEFAFDACPVRQRDILWGNETRAWKEAPLQLAVGDRFGVRPGDIGVVGALQIVVNAADANAQTGGDWR